MIRRRPLVLLSLSTLASLSPLAGCGGKKSAKTDDGGMTAAALHILSTPVHYAQVSEKLKYQAVLSQPGAAEWVLDAGPHGAVIDESGSLTWTPTDSEAGDQSFSMSATIAGQQVHQNFTVTAASTVVETSAHVDPADPNGATVAVEAPLSAVQGAAVQIDPGALPAGAPIAVTISSVQHAPVPAAARVAGIAPSDLKPVELGPNGLAFKQPVKLHLPISAAVLAKSGTPIVQTYDYASGTWQKVKVLSIDKQSGIAVAEAHHFSTYVVTPDLKVFDLKLSLGGAGTACSDALLLRAPLAPTFNEMPASSVNGYTGSGATVADVLAGMTAGQALQIYIRVGARAAAATGEQTGWVLGAATKQDDGTFKVSVTSDSHAGPFLSTPGPLAAGDPELLAWLSGSRVDFVFGGLGALAGGAVATAEASLYLVPASDADHAPPTSANALGSDEVSVTTLDALSGYDDDCDGAPNSWDAQPQGDAPPTLVGLPAGPVHVTVGSPGAFKIASPQAGVTYTWSGSDTSLTLVSGMGGVIGTATPSIAGHFQVWVTGTLGSASTRYAWDLIADPPSVQAANTPPFVAVTASASVVRVGQPVTLTALGKDAEQTALNYVWASNSATGSLSAMTGGTVVFSASQPGDYAIGCVANDGFANSPPATVTISVLSAMANRPPGAPSVTPIAAALQHAPGTPVSITITASAIDPDGDQLTYDLAPDRLTPPTFTLTKSGASGGTFSTTQDGIYVFYVTATDTHGAISPWVPVKIEVFSMLATVPTDADHDGYPAGFDCNDMDPRIFPGAKEICGDGIDQNCDGRDLGADECDLDGDRFSTAQGDCDDHNAAVNPAAIERCDGVDNNCNHTVDEGFGVGVDCTAGTGACAVAAKTVCSASYTGVVCGGAPRAPTAEVCDGVDNDCNGQIDDLTGQIGGDTANCGGCNIKCSVAPNSLAACLMGGCVSMCATGFVDADHNPANGCECRISNGGVEICDGLDNDCNGSVDEGATSVFYDGPAGTLGVGVCASGVRACMAGQPVIGRPEAIPTREICDGLDNDCNGKVDDGFDLLNDPNNCGACGLTCAPGQLCQQGKCPGGPIGTGGSSGTGGIPTADGGVINHDGGGFGGATGTDGGSVGPGSTVVTCNSPNGTICTDISYDQANCGACGHACAATETCRGGLCYAAGADCPPPRVACPDSVDPAKIFCTDPNYDPNNCGGCGKRCPAGVACQQGLCQGTTGMTTTCPATAPMACPSAAGGYYCADPKSDPANCGACGATCPGGVACQGGVCGSGGTQPCPASAPNACLSPTGAQYCANLSGDAANCGRCGLVCPAGVLCQNGACGGSGTTMCPPDRPKLCPTSQGSVCTDFTTDPMNCGNCGIACAPGIACQNGICGGGQTFACGGGTPNGCFGPTGETCTNLLNDPNNCGKCGAVCAGGTACGSGVCGGTAPAGSCPPSAPNTCQSPTAGVYCTDFNIDPANCGGCGHGCPAGVACQAGACGGGGTTMCPAAAPNACRTAAGGTYCTDVLRDSGNCGACGVVCPAGMACSTGRCVQTMPGCNPPFTSCAGGCTSLPDDPRNCGGCGILCDGTCSAGTCKAPGTGAFSTTCLVNTDCAGGLCMDQGRFAWPGGYCTSLCDASRPCAAGQICMTGQNSGGLGTCRHGCQADTDCGRAGYLCSSGVCQPDCRMAPAVCGGGQTCDPSGHCVSGQTTACPPPMAACMSATGAMFCADLATDPGNCGGCGRTCAAGTACQGGVCSGMPMCAAPAQLCTDPAGKQYCSDVTRDPGNCGACGHVCAPNAICTSGTCQGGGGVYPGLAACPGTGGGMMCTNLTADPANCGACGHACAAGTGCYGGVCSAGPPPPTCSPDMRLCGDPASGKQYCTNPLYDPANCGACGNVCPAGTGCQNAMCVAVMSYDGGTTMACPPDLKTCLDPSGKQYCSNLVSDPYNCGACGKVCPAGYACQNAMCMSGPTGGGDGGTQPAGCPPGIAVCMNATGGTYCADFNSDPYNCGGCGRACAGGYACQMAQCVQSTAPQCPMPLKPCGDPANPTVYRCIDLSSDPGNCGACGAFCPGGYVCQNYGCVPGTTTTCAAPAMACKDPATGNPYCVDTSTDPRNCGGCGFVCPNGTACTQGKCS